MNDRESILAVVRDLTEEVQRLHMAQTVQRSVYVVLVQQLHGKGLVNPGSVAKALRTMADTVSDADWQSAHAEIAGALELLQNLPSKQPKSAGHHGR